jgi:hypothetical protein
MPRVSLDSIGWVLVGVPLAPSRQGLTILGTNAYGPPSPTSRHQCHMSKRVAVGTHPGPPRGTPVYAWVVPAIAGSVRDCLRSAFYDMGRGTVQAGTGAGRSPASNTSRRRRHRFQAERGAAPKGGAFTARRAQPIRRVGELAASPSAPRSGVAEGEACGQGGNAPGCKSLLASVNVPGTTCSDQRSPPGCENGDTASHSPTNPSSSSRRGLSRWPGVRVPLRALSL